MALAHDKLDEQIAFGRELLNALPPVSTEGKNFGALATALKLDPSAAAGAWFACMANGINERPYIAQTDFFHGLAVYTRGAPVSKEVVGEKFRLVAKHAELTDTLRARIAELEKALTGMADAYVALLLIKAEDPSRFKEPGSPYANALAAISKATGAQS